MELGKDFGQDPMPADELAQGLLTLVRGKVDLMEILTDFMNARDTSPSRADSSYHTHLPQPLRKGRALVTSIIYMATRGTAATADCLDIYHLMSTLEQMRDAGHNMEEVTDHLRCIERQNDKPCAHEK